MGCLTKYSFLTRRHTATPPDCQFCRHGMGWISGAFGSLNYRRAAVVHYRHPFLGATHDLQLRAQRKLISAPISHPGNSEEALVQCWDFYCPQICSIPFHNPDCHHHHFLKVLFKSSLRFLPCIPSLIANSMLVSSPLGDRTMFAKLNPASHKFSRRAAAIDRLPRHVYQIR